jgi:translation initiation factor IF-1
MKQKGDKIITEGTVVEVLPATMFRVKVDDTGHIVLAYPCGKMRLNFIQLVVGDRVKIEMSSYDPTKARILYRISKK